MSSPPNRRRWTAELGQLCWLSASAGSGLDVDVDVDAVCCAVCEN